MAGSDMRWLPIASVFPAGLDTETAVQQLQDGFTPDGYGFDIEYPGRLVANTAQLGTGDAYTAKQNTISGDDWTWFFRRNWRIDGTTLLYGSPEYDDVIFPQDLDGIAFDETADSLLAFFPAGTTDMYVASAGGGYWIPNALSFDGDYRHIKVEEQMFATAANRATPLDQVAYTSNTNGLYSWAGGAVTEVSVNVRTALSTFANKVLRIGRDKRRVIGSNPSTDVVNFVYALQKKKLFKYLEDNTAFRYTTRTLTDSNQRPFPVRQVAFEFDNTTAARGEIVFDVKLDTGDFGNEHTAVIDNFEENYNRITIDLETTPQSHEFALRITDLSSHIHVRKIWVLTNMTTDEDSPSQ